MITPDDLERMFAAYNAQDVEGVLAFFAEDAIFDLAAGTDLCGERFEGKPAIREVFIKAFGKVEHLHYEPTDTRIAGDKAYCEQRRRETLKTGGISDRLIIDVLTFRDQQIIHKTTYWKN